MGRGRRGLQQQLLLPRARPHSRQGLAVSGTNSYGLFLDVLRKIGAYKDTNLSWLVEPGIAYTYTKSVRWYF